MQEIANVYARSLFEVAREAGSLDDVREQLGQFSDALADDQQLQVFFFSPDFSSEEKKQGLRNAISGADDAVLNFLELLIEKHRVPALFGIRRVFDELWEKENKLLPVRVTSAVELDDSTLKEIGDKIAEQTGQKVELTSDIDPDVLGGLIVQVGNTVLDASIRHNLESLRRNVARA